MNQSFEDIMSTSSLARNDVYFDHTATNILPHVHGSPASFYGDAMRINVNIPSLTHPSQHTPRETEQHSEHTEVMTLMASLDEDMQFNDVHRMAIVVYSILCTVATVGNMTVFTTLWRHHRRRTRVNLFIMHLSFADLIVATIMMPLEIGWHATVSWEAGDFSCRILMFFRVFGIYLSSFVIIAISIDRYLAVARPMSLQTADRRGCIMIIIAWIASTAASLPQSVLYHVEEHPEHPWFRQCLTFHSFPTKEHELAYNLFNLVAVYLLPLIVIIVSYALILVVISKKAKQNFVVEETLLTSCRHGVWRPRRSIVSLRSTRADIIQRARSRTLKMTVVIVSVFIVCWTPYYVMAIWWWFFHCLPLPYFFMAVFDYSPRHSLRQNRPLNGVMKNYEYFTTSLIGLLCLGECLGEPFEHGLCLIINRVGVQCPCSNTEDAVLLCRIKFLCRSYCVWYVLHCFEAYDAISMAANKKYLAADYNPYFCQINSSKYFPCRNNNSCLPVCNHCQ